MMSNLSDRSEFSLSKRFIFLYFLSQGEPGQRINFTLMDFALFVRNTSKSSPFVSHCHVYAILKELGGNDGSSGRSVTICGGKQRIDQVYMSTTHKVEVRVLGRNRNFIVNYTGNYSANLISNGNFQTESYNIITCSRAGFFFLLV